MPFMCASSQAVSACALLYLTYGRATPGACQRRWSRGAGRVRIVNRPGGGSSDVGGAQRIAEEIGAAILAGVYPPGELVPGEIDLCGRFRASRTVVREAFKLLSAKGLIASRKRAGTRVRVREQWHVLDADVLAWRLKSGEAEP